MRDCSRSTVEVSEICVWSAGEVGWLVVVECGGQNGGGAEVESFGRMVTKDNYKETKKEVNSVVISLI